MTYKLIIILCVLSLLIVPAFGDAPPWGELKPGPALYNLQIWGPDHADKGMWVTIEGRITDQDGKDMSRQHNHHSDIYYVDVFVDRGDGYEKAEFMYPDTQYCMEGDYKITTKRITSFYISYTDPSTQITYTSNIHKVTPAPHKQSPLLKFIGMAKGFFALVWFGSLFVTIGMGALAAQCHDPEKKEKYTAALFDLIKILFTVTIFYMATLFLMGS
ncbi:MAG: hypothetical protein K8R08_08155 [Methanosarcinales archaeon]|nr:hypothetical protein [Methanosarcinales archaeon]